MYKDGKAFTRIWYIFALHFTLILGWNGLWAVHTAHGHAIRMLENRKAVGIVSGGASCDLGNALDTAVVNALSPRIAL